jgi:hypothetical protein
MSGAEATAWWTEVEDVRERIERRRSLQAERGGAEPVRSVSDAPRGDGAGAGRRRRAVAAASVAAPIEPAQRRTVRIRGQAIPTVVAPRLHPSDGDAAERPRPYGTTRPSRPRPRPAERIGSNPDRLAAWAFALALLTLLVAAISAHGL